MRALIIAAVLCLSVAGAAAQPPNDAQIAHIVVTANQVDIDAGKLAEKVGSTKAVRDFGKQMVTDHSGVNQQAVALATKLKVTPEDNPTSQSLKTGGAENVKKLSGLSGATNSVIGFEFTLRNRRAYNGPAQIIAGMATMRP